MRVYAVTAEWEDERQGQWVMSLAILAESEDAAKVYARSFLAEENVESEQAIEIVSAKEWKHAQAPRVVARLVTAPGGSIVHWKDVR